MKLIDTKTHGYLDYSMGIFLIVAPFVLNLDKEGMESTVFYALGALALVYSVLTKYELGLIKIIPMKIHLLLDVLSGIFLAASPWLLGFSDKVYLPHLILGIIEIGAGLMTNSESKTFDENFI
jgi:hypothetical protein